MSTVAPIPDRLTDPVLGNGLKRPAALPPLNTLPYGTCEVEVDNPVECRLLPGQSATFTTVGYTPSVSSLPSNYTCGPATWTVNQGLPDVILSIAPGESGSTQSCSILQTSSETVSVSATTDIPIPYYSMNNGAGNTFAFCDPSGDCQNLGYALNGSSIEVLVDTPCDPGPDLKFSAKRLNAPVQAATACPIPSTSPTPSVQVTSLILKGTKSSVTVKLSDPKARTGPLLVQVYENPNVVPTPSGTPAPPHPLYTGTKGSGNYAVSFSCYTIPFGTYNEIEGDWTLSGATYAGALKHTFTIPSANLLKLLAASARGGALSAGASKYLPYMFAAFSKYGVTDPNQMAAILAEVDHETDWGTYGPTPLVEDRSETSSETKYDGELGNGAYPSTDGYTYRGRGLIQITGKSNYQMIDDNFGTDTVDYPDDIEADPQLMANIAVWGIVNGKFTTLPLSNYVNSNTQDFVDARRTVNGLDDAQTIAGYATGYQGILLVNC